MTKSVLLFPSPGMLSAYFFALLGLLSFALRTIRPKAMRVACLCVGCFSPFAFYLCLSAFICGCFSSAGYASPQPSNDMHFCLPPLNLEDMQTRDSIYVATKHALNLNVGAPRTVRMIYFLPNDRPFRQEVVDSMKVTIRQIQTFYAEQMQAQGHGRKTFRFETDAQGEPMVHRVDGQKPESHYLYDTFDTFSGIYDEIRQVFNVHRNIYFIAFDNSIDQIFVRPYDGSPFMVGVAGEGKRWLKSGGFALLPSRVMSSMTRNTIWMAMASLDLAIF